MKDRRRRGRLQRSSTLVDDAFFRARGIWREDVRGMILNCV